MRRESMEQEDDQIAYVPYRTPAELTAGAVGASACTLVKCSATSIRFSIGSACGPRDVQPPSWWDDGMTAKMPAGEPAGTISQHTPMLLSMGAHDTMLGPWGINDHLSSPPFRKLYGLAPGLTAAADAAM